MSSMFRELQDSIQARNLGADQVHELIHDKNEATRRSQNALE